MNIFNLSDFILKIWNRVLAFVAGHRFGQMEEKQQCKQCGQMRPLTDFYQHKGHRNRSRICKRCHISKNKLCVQIFQERNPAYNSEMNRKHRKRKTELQRRYNEKNRKNE